MPEIEIPDRVGKYEVRALVGRGAMGVVYSAVDPWLGRAVAIKTMSIAESPHEAELRLRFLREAQAAGQLQHPNIITVHELFEEGTTAYLVMELLEGASLSALLHRKKRLSLGQKLSVIDQIAAGLSEAHAHRIVHRDLKPSNVFVSRAGIVKVLDFGVAKVGEGELTKAGTVFGTVEYMAPEQVRGQSVTPQADIFSLGVVSYELLTGYNPFRADTLAASVFKIVSDDPARLSERDARIPEEVEAVVFHALAKQMGLRYPSMAELRKDLEAAAASVGVSLEAPTLDERDIVISKDDSAFMSVDPRVSHWANVAEQADLLEDVYRQGVQAFNDGAYEDCVSKMSQVLDEVPVHAMSLHYLSTSEEKLRQKRLAPEERARVTELLKAVRDAHRAGDAARVMETSNAFLSVDPESLEARWYRRSAEARLRGVSVGAPARASSVTGKKSSGMPRHPNPFESTGRSGQASFGYTPSIQSTLSPSAGPIEPALGSTLHGTATGSKAFWLLGSVGLLFVSLIFLWLGSLGGADRSSHHAGSDDPVSFPGVRDSPFDQVDADGTVVLDVPLAAAADAGATTSIRYIIPTSILTGERTTLGLFGAGFSADSSVVVSDRRIQVLSVKVRSPEHIEIEILAEVPPGKVDVAVENPGGARAAISLEVTAP